MTEKLISIHLNGQAQEVAEGSSLSDLFKALELKENFAVALNNNVIPKAELQSSSLKDGDWVELIQAVAGG